MQRKVQNVTAVLDYVKKHVDFPHFLESQIGCNLKWYKAHRSAATRCPMPNHKDDLPSFRIQHKEADGIWVYHCFGCGSGGTIVDFFMDYYGLSNLMEAVEAIAEKFGFTGTEADILRGMKDIKKQVDTGKKMECAHIVACNQCRMLLRKNYEKYAKWVAQAYRRMNDALDAEKIDVIEQVGSEASRKMGEHHGR